MDISFESFCTLVYRLGHPPKSKDASGNPTPLAPSTIFTSWLKSLPKPLTPHTGKHLFRLLFPQEGGRRRYGLKETKLAAELERTLVLKGLTRWDSVNLDRTGDGGSGCLGNEVRTMIKDRIPVGTRSSLTLAQLDRYLDELASHSPFSQLSQNPYNPAAQSIILSTLFRDAALSSCALAVLTQIILRDLRPLLNPLPHLVTRNPTALLRLKSTSGPAQMSMYEAMRCWSPVMHELYQGGKGSLDWCADQAAVFPVGTAGTQGYAPPLCPPGPLVGVNVQIPKCRKGRSIEDALGAFSGSSRTTSCQTVWAETKYDGYRMQIHVQMVDGNARVTIFSKSKRNSTEDRINSHAIILAALGLSVDPVLPRHNMLPERLAGVNPAGRRLRQSVILEAEVVPYNEGRREGGRGPGIEEFWWLTSAGVSDDGPKPSRLEDRNRHLCLCFFDILHLDGMSLLGHTYRQRRQLLSETVSGILGFCMIAKATPILLGAGRQAALQDLRAIFSRSQARFEEGLVLKADESFYLDPRWPWVKLKRDYIPNLGDCVDLVVVGAGWEIDRARELRVDTAVFTTFYIAALTNRDRVHHRRELPHFEILFRVSYGPDRAQLEIYNENIRHRKWKSKPYDRDDPFKKRLLGLSWTYYMPRSMPSPSVLFEQPLCAEIMGAGFQKLPFSDLFEVRWPRLQKIFEPRERSWTEGMVARDLIDIAHRALGYAVTTPITSPQDDSVRAAWRSSSAVNLTDIPDLPTPPRHRFSPTHRVQSAPDLMNIIKVSPPTPITAGRAPRRPFEAAERLQNIMSDELPNENSLPLFPGTPTTSPIKRGFGSPIRPQSPSPKRLRHQFGQIMEQSAPAKLARSIAIMHTLTPPPSSPPAAIMPRCETSPSRSLSKHRLKARSLRSRIWMASRVAAEPA